MLRWRLIIGALLIAALLALCWADARMERAGSWLAGLAILAAILAAGELRRMYRLRGVDLSANGVYLGAVMPVLFSAVPVFFPVTQFRLGLGNVGWLAIGLTFALMDSFTCELRRYKSPGASIVRVAHATLCILYVGGLIGMLVQLRIVMPPTQTGGWVGLYPLLSMIATVKLSDTCQYVVGRSIGRHKLAPLVSPGKTWEGAVGGILLATLLAAYGMTAISAGYERLGILQFLVAWLYALTVSIAGLIGDLSESLLKRDAGVKDSSDWLPGFGGVLDLLDSILFAGPVAYIWWLTGLLAY